MVNDPRRNETGAHVSATQGHLILDHAEGPASTTLGLRGGVLAVTGRSECQDPSTHLSWAELACHDPDRTRYPVEWRDARAAALAAVFERFRAFCGGHPLTVGSGYRTPAWNRKQGGVERSQHVQGKAIDLYPPAGVLVPAFHEFARVFADMEPLIGGLGLYAWGAHLDIRIRSGRCVTWNRVPPGTAMHDTRA